MRAVKVNAAKLRPRRTTYASLVFMLNSVLKGIILV